jgi:hypothetical protein
VNYIQAKLKLVNSLQPTVVSLNSMPLDCKNYRGSQIRKDTILTQESTTFDEPKYATVCKHAFFYIYIGKLKQVYRNKSHYLEASKSQISTALIEYLVIEKLALTDVK